MTIPGGYLKLHRRIRDSWQWSRPEWRSAWTWLMVEASGIDRPDKGLMRGQLWGSMKQMAQAWGMSRSGVRRFLQKAEKMGDLQWERGRGGWHGLLEDAIFDQTSEPPCEPPCGAGSEPALEPAFGRITLLKYDTYNPSCNGGEPALEPAGEPPCEPASEPLPKKEKKEKKEKKKSTPPSGVPPLQEEHTDSTRVYNWFIRHRRQAMEIQDWLPSAALAIQMRKNIQELLGRYSCRELLDWMVGFFEGDFPKKRNFPWGMFAADPTQFKATTNGHRPPDPEAYFNG